MTATAVRGAAVLAVEPVASRWVDKGSGAPRVYRTIVRLLLEDGTEVFGCTKCDYTADGPNSVAAHQRTHTVAAAREATPAPAAAPTPPAAGVAPKPAPPRKPATKAKPVPVQVDRRPGAGTPADRTIRGRPTSGDRQRAVTAEAALYRIRELIDEVLPR